MEGPYGPQGGMGRRPKYFSHVAPAGQAVRVMVWLGLESWSTRPAGQAVRVMVWLGLESWSTRPTGQAVRVMVWLGLESWSDTYTLFPRSHHMLSILRLG